MLTNWLFAKNVSVPYTCVFPSLSGAVKGCLIVTGDLGTPLSKFSVSKNKDQDSVLLGDEADILHVIDVKHWYMS
jgi:hypothetical protein